MDEQSMLMKLITDLKTDINARFDRVDKNVADLVTKAAFDATVERLDAQHTALRLEFDRHDKAAPDYRKAASDRAEAVREELNAQLGEFRSTTRWAIGLAIPATGVLIGALQYIIAILR